MNDRRDKAFDFANETIKQLISLSIAIITFTVTFSNELLKGISDITARVIIGSSA